MLLVLQVLLFSLHVWTFTAESELTCSHQPIVAQTGDDVILPCSFDPPISASSQTVEWFRPDLDPRYIHVHRDGKQTSDQHSSYVNRTKLFVDELKNGNVSLKIFSVNVSDAGTYKCFLPIMDKQATIKLIVGGDSRISTYTIIIMVGNAFVVLGALAALFAGLVCRCRCHRAAESYRQELIPTVSFDICDSALARPRSVSPLCSTSVTAESKLTCSHQPIVAQTGDDVILPCSLHPPISATSQTVEWTRPDLDPRYIHVHRDGKQTSDQHSSYVNRTKLFVDELKNGNVSLKISGVKVSDAGTYKCYLPSMQKQATIELFVDSDSEENASDNEPGPAQSADPGEDGSWCVIS